MITSNAKKRGQATVELASLLPLLCLLLFATLDLGRYIQAQSRMTNAAHVALIDAQNVENAQGTFTTVAAVQTAVARSYSDVTITIQPSTIYNNEAMTVTASTPFRLITPFVRTLVGTTAITATAAGQTLP